MSTGLADAAVVALRAIPRSTATHAIGWLAERPVPPSARPVVLGGIGRLLGIDLSEAEKALGDYRTVQELFCRRLRPGARGCAVAVEEDRQIVSPVDGLLHDVSVIRADGIFEVKGRPFDLEALLGDAERARGLHGGTALTFYLAPRDYHRMHSPVSGRVESFRWLPGDFWPVNELSERIPGIYSENERVVTYLDTAYGRVAMVKVAAFGVGYISLSYRGEPAGQRVHRRSRPMAYHYRSDQAPRVVAGEEIAAFGLGSTVVLCVERGRARFAGLEAGRTVQVCEVLGRFLA